MGSGRVHIIILLIAFLSVFGSYAQDLEPRMMSAIPTGGNFAIASYSHSSGNILLDNSLPIEDLKIAFTSGLSTRYGADFTSVILAYQYIWFDKKLNHK